MWSCSGAAYPGSWAHPLELQSELLRASPGHTRDMNTVCQQGIRDNSSHWAHQNAIGTEKRQEKHWQSNNTSLPQPLENTFEQRILPIGIVSVMFFNSTSILDIQKPNSFYRLKLIFLPSPSPAAVQVPYPSESCLLCGCRTRIRPVLQSSTPLTAVKITPALVHTKQLRAGDAQRMYTQ